MAKPKKYSDDFGEQWQCVERWRIELQNNARVPMSRPPGSSVQRAHDGGPGNESLNRLENAWQQCQEFNEWPGIKSREAARTMGRAPLAALFCYVDMGLYPPPEVLLAAMECFNRYIDAQGEIELEAAFFGKRVQGVGTYAERCAKRQRDLRIAMDMAIHNRDGRTDDEAAEIIADDLLEEEGIRLGVDSIKAIAREKAPRVSRGKKGT